MKELISEGMEYLNLCTSGVEARIYEENGILP